MQQVWESELMMVKLLLQTKAFYIYHPIQSQLYADYNILSMLPYFSLLSNQNKAPSPLILVDLL